MPAKGGVIRLFFSPPPDCTPGDASLRRIRSLLALARSPPERLMSGPGDDVRRAMETVHMHALATAADHGAEGYLQFRGKGACEDEVLSAINALPPESLRLLAPDLAYIASKSRFESVRLAAAFCLDE